MKQEILKRVIRTAFFLTSRKRASASARKMLKVYEGFADKITEGQGRKIIEVPLMAGVDEEMRQWSFYMILEHNVLVNRAITANMQQLALGETLHGDAVIDPQKDVLPSLNPGPEQVERFTRTVHQHLEIVKTLDKLRGTQTSTHPLFGEFDAHFWHCLFSFHLKIHLRQTRLVLAA